MTLGPVQFLAVGFDRIDLFTGAIRRELQNLRSRGLIRLLDALFIMKDEDGAVTRLEASDLSEEDKARLGAVLGGLLGLSAASAEDVVADVLAESAAPADQVMGLSASDIRSLVTDLPPGKAVALFLMEHVWATDFKVAVREASGHPLMQGYLTPESLLLMGREVEAVAQAEEALEIAEAVEGAAMIDALQSIAAADQIEAEVAQDVAARVTARVKSGIAAETIRALVLGGVLHESATGWAFEVLVEQGIIDPDTAAEAQQAVEALNERYQVIAADQRK
jgi:uncharacterized membrane protein